ncbi:MAG: HD domain-containing protein, partial [Cellvibrionaceae bacterium]|nr:HD domain-containing protein [Cellvibrionaceae bacterium]
SAIQSGDQCNLQVVRESVQPLITGVFHNKDAIAALVRLKRISEYRYQHGVSMAVWSAILGRHISLPMAQLEKLVVACAMCDIGMTRLPDSIIHQPDALTASQWKMVKMHPELGVKMVRESSDQQDPEVLGIIECHHERFDGSGYPNGHRASDIPLLARIAGLVDAYDAMITSRPHAHGLSSYEAIQQLISAKGELFQDALVEQFVQAIGLFPTGSLVEFNTGEVGIVVKQNEMRRLKPEVVIVLDSHKQKLSDLLLLDLTDLGEAATSRWITLALRPGSYGVNCEEYFI